MKKPSQQKRSRSRAVREDRLSSLPYSVICHIFSFLATIDVVATSVLSKRWKDLWTKVSTLNFIDNSVQFINRVLLHVDSQVIDTFHLKWWGGGSDFDPAYVAMWISYAITRKVRFLVIDLGFWDSDYRPSIHLPGKLFTSATLQSLKIHGCFVFKVPTSVCLPKLELLDLRDLLSESKDDLQKLIQGCPVLDTMDCTVSTPGFTVISPSLRRFQIFNGEHKCDGKLEIDAPNLEYFALHQMFKEFSVKSLDSVNSAVLDLDVSEEGDIDYFARPNSIVKLTEAMSRVERLTLKGEIIHAIGIASIPLTTSFKSLIILDVHHVCCHWYSLRVVLDQSPKLQVLNITKDKCYHRNHCVCWHTPAKVVGCLLSSLQKVTFVGFEGLEDEMAMMKYILQHGQMLESVTFKSPVDYNNKKQLLRQVSRFPRCSRACQVYSD